MIDPTVRRCTGDDRDVSELVRLEVEAREALVDQRGGVRWLVEHPIVGDGWSERCRTCDVWLAHIDDVVVGYMVAVLGDDLIVRIDQVWITPQARELGFGDGLLAAAIGSARKRGALAVEGQALPGGPTDEEPVRASRHRRPSDHHLPRTLISDPSNSAGASR